MSIIKLIRLLILGNVKQIRISNYYSYLDIVSKNKEKSIYKK